MSNTATLERTNHSTFKTGTSKKKEKKERRHAILEKPYLQLFLVPIITFLIASGFALGPAIIITGTTGYRAIPFEALGAVIVGIALLVIHRLIMKEVPVTLTTKNLGKGLLMGAPLLVLIGLNAEGGVFTPRVIAYALMLGIVPGILEELSYRAFTCANAMKFTKKNSNIFFIAFGSALVFGAFHLFNVTAGQDVATTLCQAWYAVGIGLLFAAIYLRTGNILATIIYHTLIDAAASLNPVLQATGTITITGGFSLYGVMVGILCFGYGLFLLRKSKWDEIREVWNAKFATVK